MIFGNRKVGLNSKIKFRKINRQIQMNKLEELLNNIKEKEFKLILNEVGAGMPVYTKMVSISGLASDKIIHAESNNDIEYSRTANGIGGRMVSKESAQSLALSTFYRVSEYYMSDIEYTIVLSNTVQLSDGKRISHGYFYINKMGIGERFGETYCAKQQIVHYTLPIDLTREQQIDMIGIIGLDILNCFLNDNINFANPYIDDIYETDNLNENIKKTLNTLRNSGSFVVDNGEIKRTAELFRNDKDIIIFKGSFNPVTKAHIHMAELTKQKYGGEPIFAISLSHRYNEKNNIDYDNIVDRINLLNSLGYKVLINTRPMFGDLNDSFYLYGYNKDFNHTVRYILGADIYKQLITDDHRFATMGITNILSKLSPDHFDNFMKDKYKKASFVVFNRKNNEIKNHIDIVDYIDDEIEDVSSTEIRSKTPDWVKDQKYTDELIIYKYDVNDKNRENINI